MIPQPLWSEILHVVHKVEDAPGKTTKIEDLNVIDIIEKNFMSMSITNAALATRPLLGEMHQKKEQQHINPNRTDQSIKVYLEPLYKNQTHKELSKSIIEWYEFQRKILNDSFIDTETEIIWLQSVNEKIEGPAYIEMAFKAMVNKMLDLEFATLVSDQIILGNWEIDLDKEKDLIDFIKSSVDSFGGFCIFLGIWSPKQNDISPMIRKMELLASIYSVDYSRGYKLNQEGKRVFIEI